MKTENVLSNSVQNVFITSPTEEAVYRQTQFQFVCDRYDDESLTREADNAIQAYGNNRITFQ